MTDIRPDYYRVEVKVTINGRPTTATLECFDLIDAVCEGDFYLGNVIKYLFRAGRKSGERQDDLNKTITYLKQRIKRDTKDTEGKIT